MKVDITDESIFSKINPETLSFLLKSQGWIKIKEIKDEFSIWKIQDPNICSKAWLPLNRQFDDYNASIKKIVSLLSEQLDKSQLDILEDIETSEVGDVLRVRGFDPLNRHGGTIGIDEGIALFEKGRKMLISGAYSCYENRAIIPAKRPTGIDDYIKTIKIGQTERGSYIAKFISPIKKDDQYKIHSVEEVAPFSRQAVKNLMVSLDNLKRIVDNSTKKGFLIKEEFLEGIGSGINANLCLAVFNEDKTPLEISAVFSNIFNEILDSTPKKVFFSMENMPILKAAADMFYEEMPLTITIDGYIIKLQRNSKDGTGGGEATAIFNDGDGNKRIKMYLNENDYSNATHAHNKGLNISCSGVLIKEGRNYKIKDYTSFTVHNSLLFD